MKWHLLIVLVFSSIFVANAQLSDDEVYRMIETARSTGKSQNEIALYLLANGASEEQVARVNNSFVDINQQDTGHNDDRRRLMTDSLSVYSMPQPKKFEVFGKEIFNNNRLTFTPQLNIPTPTNYRLGPGDEVIIDVWGNAEKTVRQVISPEGSILVENLGPIYLAGHDIKEAANKVKWEFARIHSDLTSDQPNTYINLSLGKIRSIQINVLGEATLSGTFTLPSLATAFHALYSAGGANDLGTLRDIKIYRKGKLIKVIDVYKYLLTGDDSYDIGLLDGDNIIIEPYNKLVSVTGPVKRPMKYEIKDDETLNDLLNYAGGYTSDAYKKNINLIRKGEVEYKIFTVDTGDILNFYLEDGDRVEVSRIIDRYENKVAISGAVYRPGDYALSDELQTLLQLVKVAEGVVGDAFVDRILLYRLNPDLSTRVESVDLGAILRGDAPDITLQKDDSVYISSYYNTRENQYITVHGAVMSPGVFPFVHDMTIEDIILVAGGLRESASTVRVDVSRRIKDPKRTSESPEEAILFSLSINDGLLIDGSNGFTLKPFDEIFIHKSPGYATQQNVFVEGEVMFEGAYTKTYSDERISHIVERAGGLTSKAYVRGARLERQMNEDEWRQVESILRLTTSNSQDSLSVDMLNVSNTYYVGIDLQKALAQPGGDYDLVLREGDKLIIPVYSNTVKISGAVMYPNTVTFDSQKGINNYISNAGGVAPRAKKRNTYIVYMNGMVVKRKTLGKNNIEPGCEIIVPSKPAKNGLGIYEIMSLANSTTSMAALITSIINMTK